MTIVYFVRHAQPNYNNHDDLTRELTAQGLVDRMKVVDALRETTVDAVLSSPYQRAVDTVQPLADLRGLTVETDADFRERKVGDGWLEDFTSFAMRQWSDFDFALECGESLRQVQKRNMAALRRAMEKYPGEPLAIATHGTAMGTILNHFDPQWGYQSFLRILDVMPYIVRLEIDTEGRCIAREEILMMQKQWRRP